MLKTIKDTTIFKHSILKVHELNLVKSDSLKIEKVSKIVDYSSKTLDSMIGINNGLNSSTAQEIFTEILWGMPIATAAIIISSLITISVFIVGYLINWLNKKYERKSELESVKSVVTVWVELLKSPILQQVEGCRDFAIALRNSHDIHPERMSYNKLLADKLKSIELRELIQVFIINSEGDENDKSKNLFNLVSQIDFLIQVEDKIPEAYIIFQNRTFYHMENWNQKLKELDLLKVEMTTFCAHNPHHHSYPLFDEFQKLVNNLVQQFANGSSVVDTKRILLEPLENYTSKFINLNPHDQMAHQLAGKIQELNMIYREWEVHFEGNAKVFYDFAIRLVSVYKTLFKATNQLKIRKFKPVWKLN